MSAPVYIVGVGSTPVGKHPERSFTDLVATALDAAADDARLENRDRIEATWFSNSLMDFWGQRAVRGQAVLTPLMLSGRFPNGNTIINVEDGCASGSVAFNGAWSAVRQGADLALALGVEKMHDPSRSASEFLQWMDGTGNMLDPDLFWGPFRSIAAEHGLDLQQDPNRSLGMDAYSVFALTHMKRYGTTIEQIAYAAAKNHTNAVGNPRAQYRFPMTIEEVLGDRMVAEPLTRAMCAPRGDAGSAVLVCSQRYLDAQPSEVRNRAILVRGHSLRGGLIDTDGATTWEKRRAPVRAAEEAYALAGVAPSELDLVELHDAASFAEIALVEDLGLCARGEGGPFTESGATRMGGQIPVNPSGGLVSRGHPIGATGLTMLHEVVLQLRHEAGEVQVRDPRIGLVENGGGLLGLDNAVSAVTILEGAAD
ncbi:acetyl-CoA acetyltransferase [Nocardioides sp. BE266]|uniref:thiolase family protein n=1 Tax=Nocardioides sp. BE266 TaxID=2817725 RepID=UPI002865620D|nr:thiolase family protein [Nocardioides sp. BE266]MDR7255066.1 acetyl-CoA acetyltransferase [Nocardioides sp. BE266]